jgi:hypothetical protein
LSLSPEFLILDPSVLASSARFGLVMEAIGDIKTFVLPTPLYKLLEAADAEHLAGFISRWERIRRDEEFEAWISRLVKEEFPRWGYRLLPSSRPLESYRFGIADLPSNVKAQIDDLLLKLVSKDEVMGDILKFSVYSGAAALSFSTRYHRALSALEVPVAEVQVACIPLFKEMKKRKLLYIDRMKNVSLEIGGRKRRVGRVVLYLAGLVPIDRLGLYAFGSVAALRDPIAQAIFTLGVTFTIGVIEKDGWPWT